MVGPDNEPTLPGAEDDFEFDGRLIDDEGPVLEWDEEQQSAVEKAWWDGVMGVEDTEPSRW